MTLLELADRVEAATEPDRELDVAIAVATDWRWADWEDYEPTARSMAEKHGLSWLVERTEHNSVWRCIPRYTASLDCAMSLVEGWDPSFPVNVTMATAYGSASVMPIDDRSTGIHDRRGGHARLGRYAPVPALLAAALRARANVSEQEE